MIRINLLYAQKTKKKKKKVQVETQLIWVGLLAVILAVSWFIGWRSLEQKVNRLNTVESGLSEELTSLKAELKSVENFEDHKKIVQGKIKLIQQLRKNQSIPVALLSEISERLPSRVWLLSLTQRSGGIELSGKATTNSEIVDFINNLKSVPLFQNIRILESRKNQEGSISVYSFRLQWDIVI